MTPRSGSMASMVVVTTIGRFLPRARGSYRALAASRGGQLTLAHHAPHESTLQYTACTDIKSKGDGHHD